MAHAYFFLLSGVVFNEEKYLKWENFKSFLRSRISPYWVLGLSVFIMLAIILLIKSVKIKENSYVSLMFIFIGKNTLLLYCLNFMTIKIGAYFVPKTNIYQPINFCINHIKSNITSYFYYSFY